MLLQIHCSFSCCRATGFSIPSTLRSLTGVMECMPSDSSITRLTTTPEGVFVCHNHVEHIPISIATVTVAFECTLTIKCIPFDC